MLLLPIITNKKVVPVCCPPPYRKPSVRRKALNGGIRENKQALRLRTVTEKTSQEGDRIKLPLSASYEQKRKFAHISNVLLWWLSFPCITTLCLLFNFPPPITSKLRNACSPYNYSTLPSILLSEDLTWNSYCIALSFPSLFPSTPQILHQAPPLLHLPKQFLPTLQIVAPSLFPHSHQPVPQQTAAKATGKNRKGRRK